MQRAANSTLKLDFSKLKEIRDIHPKFPKLNNYDQKYSY